MIAIKPPRHYYGDTTRVLFIGAAAVLILDHFIGSPFLTTDAMLISVIVLVIAAGLTDPIQTWIHFVNVAIAIAGFLVSGFISVTHYQAGELLLDESLVIFLAVLFLFAMYFSTRTVRAVLLRGKSV